MTKCSICQCEIEDGVGRYNAPTGTECMKCYENPKKHRKDPKYVTLGGIKIPYKKLKEYAEIVDYTRRAALMGKTKDDPLIVMKALENRVKIHKQIFKIAGIDHNSTEPKAMKIRKDLEKWLEKNVMTPIQMKGLV